MPPFTTHTPLCHACPPSPHMPPPLTTHAPTPHHAWPHPLTMHASLFAMHAPSLPCMNPPGATTHAPQEQPCTAPWKQPHTPPRSNHACLPQGQPHMHPLGATTHPRNHARPPCGQTDTCKNITFANFVCGR